MTLLQEAAYMYLFTKRLVKLNKQIKKHSQYAHKHRHKYHQASEGKKDKHKEKFHRTKLHLQKLLKEHNMVLGYIKHHQSTYADRLKREHKL